MTILTALFLTAVAIALALAIIAVWSRRRLAPRFLAVFAAALFMPVAYGAMSELLSRPKPTRLEWVRAQAEEAKVLAADMQEDVAIYLWLRLPDDPQPLAYVLPWSKEAAKQLQGAMRKAEGEKSEVRMRTPFRRQKDNQESLFYAPPQQPLPNKLAEGAGAPVMHFGPQNEN
jgi:Zn-dependent protease with chaperone function